MRSKFENWSIYAYDASYVHILHIDMTYDIHVHDIHVQSYIRIYTCTYIHAYIHVHMYYMLHTCSMYVLHHTDIMILQIRLPFLQLQTTTCNLIKNQISFSQHFHYLPSVYIHDIHTVAFTCTFITNQPMESIRVHVHTCHNTYIYNKLYVATYIEIISWNERKRKRLK